MDTDSLIGLVYQRPGSGDPEDRWPEDHWKVIAVRRDDRGPLVVLRSGDGETVTLSLSHLREPYWRPVELPEPPDAA